MFQMFGFIIALLYFGVIITIILLGLFTAIHTHITNKYYEKWVKENHKWGDTQL